MDWHAGALRRASEWVFDSCGRDSGLGRDQYRLDSYYSWKSKRMPLQYTTETEPQHAREMTHALVGPLETEQDDPLARPAGHAVHDREGE